MSKAFLHAYIEAALWSSTDNQGEPLDRNYSRADLAPETLAKMREDCEAFERDNETDLACNDASQGGHDFWLTRNGHGCGFWETPDWPEAEGERLTAAAEKFGDFNLYVGDDGRIYGM